MTQGRPKIYGNDSNPGEKPTWSTADVRTSRGQGNRAKEVGQVWLDVRVWLRRRRRKHAEALTQRIHDLVRHHVTAPSRRPPGIVRMFQKSFQVTNEHVFGSTSGGASCLLVSISSTK